MATDQSTTNGETANSPTIVKGVTFQGQEGKSKKRQFRQSEPLKLSGLLFLSDWLFIWVWSLVNLFRKVDYRDVKLKLNIPEEARLNADTVLENWNKEKEASKTNGYVFISYYSFENHPDH